MSNTNCGYCSYCKSCNYCESCGYCDSCWYCESCGYCSYCKSCKYCDSCSYCSYCESCSYCKDLRMSEKMIFCLGDGKYESKGEGYQKHLRIFNQDVTEEEYRRVRALLNGNKIKIQFTKWTDYDDLKEDEKTITAKQLGGLLKTFTYEEAWANFWNEATSKQKNTILDLPQFDKDIFKGITGLDVEKEDDATVEAMKLLKSKGFRIVKN